jgi:hypothetical protein
MQKKRYAAKTTRKSEPEAHSRAASSILYWSTILFLTLMNFIVAIILVPFFLATPTLQLYLTIAIFGLLFGQLFNVLITRIEYLERHHHLFASIFIPLIAIVALLAVLSLSRSLASVLGVQITQNPRITILVYIASFILPYSTSRLLSKI